MYPKNAASPERIAVGPVVQISDGAVQTADVLVKVMPQGGAAAGSGGTIGYVEGIVHYIPTQAETNYTSFMVIAYKTGCIPACVTVVTTASATPGIAVCADTQKVDVNTVKTQTVTCGAGVTVLASVGTAATSTAQTGDSYAIVNGDHGLVSIQDDIDLILEDTGTTIPGTLTTISGYVDCLPATLNNLSSADVTSACTSSLNSYDAPTNIEMVAAFTEIKGATWATTDTLEAIRDRGDAAWITAVGFSTHAAADVVTALGTGTTLTAIPWNASWDSEVQSECTDALNAYDPPTAAEVTTAINTAWTTTTLAEDYPADNAAATPAELLYLILGCVSEFAISSTTLTVKKLDGSTTAATYTLDSATTPTSRTRAS